MLNFARLLTTPHRARFARLLLALWAMLVLPALAHPLHERANAARMATVAATHPHCGEHTATAPTDAAHNCLCLQTCAGAIATLAAVPTLPQLHHAAAPQFALPNNSLPASPSSNPYRPPIAARSV